MVRRCVRLSAVTIGLLTLGIPGWAKPPGLPANVTDDCVPPAALNVEASPTTTCPRMAPAPRRQPEIFAGPWEQGVLDNLLKLYEARTHYELADFYRRNGNFPVAEYFYERVRELCPGSRWDALATAQLECLRAWLAGTSEEAELDPSSATAPQQDSQPSDAETPASGESLSPPEFEVHLDDGSLCANLTSAGALRFRLTVQFGPFQCGLGYDGLGGFGCDLAIGGQVPDEALSSADGPNQHLE
ncbi:MAG: tetratricopeptide repeat protein [Gemmataceae bacterium]|nr:tetratricopeptide repeat protein [Gemmataceae bacterium]MDW8265968.1 tetratricopeptide repeat protein [Gemmataceae bacterium]